MDLHPGGDDDDERSEDYGDSPDGTDGRGIAAEVIGALDAVTVPVDAAGDDFTLNDDMHVEAADLSLVSKKGRLLASFRKGKSA